MALPYRPASRCARWRLPLTTLGVLMLPIFSWRYGRQGRTAALKLAGGAGLTLAGLLLRTWAAGHLYKGQGLAVSGPYKHLRHPLYAGSGMIALGHGLCSRVPGAALLNWGLWYLLYRSAMREEEQHLEGEYGEDYRVFEATVPPVWPCLRPAAVAGSPRRWSYRQALVNREYEAWLANALVLVVYRLLYTSTRR